MLQVAKSFNSKIIHNSSWIRPVLTMCSIARRTLAVYNLKHDFRSNKFLAPLPWSWRYNHRIKSFRLVLFYFAFFYFSFLFFSFAGRDVEKNCTKACRGKDLFINGARIDRLAHGITARIAGGPKVETPWHNWLVLFNLVTNPV